MLFKHNIYIKKCYLLNLVKLNENWTINYNKNSGFIK